MSRGWIAVVLTCFSLGACGGGSENASPGDLMDLQQRVVADRERDRLDLGEPYDVELNRSEGVIVVTVAERTDELADAFEERYGDHVVVREGLLAQPE
ncbi:MAG: hypothetical protein M3331_02025 [Actinomycetota bacterium]|nr:hypothetical protein [Actinomycetota bacterium]